MSDQADTSPTLPVPPMAQPPTSSVLISVEPTPKPKRGKALAIFAVAALLIGGFVTYLVTADSGSEQYSLKAAMQGAQQPQSSAFEMSFGLGAMGAFAAEGRIDVENNLMAMSMDMSLVGGPEVNMIMDLENGVAYMDTEGLDDMDVDSPTRWISFDAGDVADIGLGIGSNPSDMTAVLEDSDLVENVGFDEFRGEKVRVYRVTVPVDDVMASNPDFIAQYEDMGVELPESFIYEVFVTKDNQLRRMAFDMDLMGQTLTTEIVFTAYGDIDPIELPDPSDVTEESIPGL